MEEWEETKKENVHQTLIFIDLITDLLTVVVLYQPARINTFCDYKASESMYGTTHMQNNKFY